MIDRHTMTYPGSNGHSEDESEMKELADEEPGRNIAVYWLRLRGFSTDRIRIELYK